MDPRVKKILEDKGIISLNGEKFRHDNHEMDNRIIFHFEDLLEGYSFESFKKIVGYSEHPAFERDDDVGVMFETYDGDEIWCHIPSIFFEPDSSYFRNFL